MQMTAFDYVRNQPSNTGSLAKLASTIKELRRDAAQTQTTCLLFDNGDTFQGTPVADYMARQDANAPHPMVTSMRQIGYDACGLGNHDFDYGLSRLALSLAQLEIPVVCSNIASAYLPMVQPHLMLERWVTGLDGQERRLRIGLLSSLPDKTALWSKYHLEDRATLAAPLPILRKAAAKLRAQGADLVIVLAHMGIAQFEEGPEAQNQIQDVAALEDVDVVIGGHTHLRFPGPEHDGIAGVDTSRGTVNGKPVVQPGPLGADIGVIDLSLRISQGAKRWHVAEARVSLKSTTCDTAEDPRILSAVKSTHAKTIEFLSVPVAKMAKPMHSYFALADPSPLPALLAHAKLRTISNCVAGTEYEALPLLAAASAPLTGGLDGPDNFLYLDAGPLERRHIAGMNPYANNVWAVKTSGAQLLDWLERSAMIFNTLVEDQPEQELIDPNVPGFRYDAIYGLSYEIDPRVPPRFTPSGRRNNASTGRIKNVCWNGKPLDIFQNFLVATTDHRAGGGGLYVPFSNEDIAVSGTAPLQDAVCDYFKKPDCAAIRADRPWRFLPGLKRSAILRTSPQAAQHLNEIAHLNPEACGETEEGFLRVRLHL